MDKKIIWTPGAEESFDEVLVYLDNQWSEREVINFIHRTDTIINHIIRFPLAFRSAGRDDVREALVTKQNLLLYRVSGETLYLLYFWDTRKNPMRKPI